MSRLTSRSRYGHVVVLGASLLALSLLVPAAGHAASYLQNLTFATSDQSMWAPGSAVIITYDPDPWTVKWDESVNFGEIIGDECTTLCFGWFGCHTFCNPLPDTGVEVSASTSGEVGFDFEFFMDSGSVDVQYPVAVELTYPKEAKPGDMITISSDYIVDPEAYFSTNSPDLQTSLDFIFEVYAGIDGRACIAGACVDGEVSINIDNQENAYIPSNVFYFNSDTQEFSLLGVDNIGGFQFGEPYDFESGEVTVSIPSIETKGTSGGGDTLSSQGESDFLELTFDVDYFISEALKSYGVPKFEGDIADGLIHCPDR